MTGCELIKHKLGKGVSYVLFYKMTLSLQIKGLLCTMCNISKRLCKAANTPYSKTTTGTNPFSSIVKVFLIIVWQTYCLPVTWRVTNPRVLPCLLVAVQMYCPESVCTRSLMVRVEREFVLAREGRGWRLARDQMMLNGPGPLTSQVKMTECPTGSSTRTGLTSTTGSRVAV